MSKGALVIHEHMDLESTNFWCEIECREVDPAELKKILPKARDYLPGRLSVTFTPAENLADQLRKEGYSVTIADD